jgi:hypothetical protein
VAESLWLGLGAKLPAFRRYVDDQADGVRRARIDDEVTAGMRGLGPELSARLVAVGQNISWIVMRAETGPLKAEARAALLELESLRPAFMRLCLVRERAAQRLEELNASPPELEAARLARAYAAEKDLGLRFTLHQAIKQAQKQSELKHRLGELEQQVEVKLSLVEQALAHLRGQQQLGLLGSDLSREVAGIMAHVLLVPALEAELEP